jgi:hypothetical protein
MVPSVVTALLCLLMWASGALAVSCGEVQSLDRGAIVLVDTMLTDTTQDCTLTLALPVVPGARAAFEVTAISPTVVYNFDRPQPAPEPAPLPIDLVVLVESSVPLTASLGGSGTPLPSLTIAASDLSQTSLPPPIETDVKASSAARASPSFSAVQPDTGRRFVSRTAFLSREAADPGELFDGARLRTVTVTTLSDGDTHIQLTVEASKAGGSPAFLRAVLQYAALGPCNSSVVYEFRHSAGSDGLMPLVLATDSDGAGPATFAGQVCQWRVFTGENRSAFEVEHVGSMGVYMYGVTAYAGQLTIQSAGPSTSTFPLRSSTSEDYTLRPANLRRYVLLPRGAEDERRRTPSLTNVTDHVALGSVEFSVTSSVAASAGGLAVIVSQPQLAYAQPSDCIGADDATVTVGTLRKVRVRVQARAGNVRPFHGTVTGGRDNVRPNCTFSLRARCTMYTANGGVYGGEPKLGSRRFSPIGLAINASVTGAEPGAALRIRTPRMVSPRNTSLDVGGGAPLGDIVLPNSVNAGPSFPRFFHPDDFEGSDDSFELAFSVLGSFNVSSPMTATIDGECRALSNVCPATGEEMDIRLPIYAPSSIYNASGPTIAAMPVTVGFTLYSDLDGAGPEVNVAASTCRARLTCASGFINVTRVAYKLSMVYSENSWGKNQDQRSVWFPRYFYDAAVFSTTEWMNRGPIVLPAFAQTEPVQAIQFFPVDWSLVYTDKSATHELALAGNGSTPPYPNATTNDFNRDRPPVGLAYSPLTVQLTRFKSFYGGLEVDAHCVPTVCQMMGCSPAYAPPNRSWFVRADYRGLPTHAENCTTLVDMNVACFPDEDIEAEIFADAAMDLNSVFINDKSFPNSTMPTRFRIRRGLVVISVRARPSGVIKYSLSLECRRIPPSCQETGKSSVAATGSFGVIITNPNGIGGGANTPGTCNFLVSCGAQPNSPRAQRPNALHFVNVSVSGVLSMTSWMENIGRDSSGNWVFREARAYDRIYIVQAPVVSGGAEITVAFPTTINTDGDKYAQLEFNETATLRAPFRAAAYSATAFPGAAVVSYACQPAVCAWLSNASALPASVQVAAAAAAAAEAGRITMVTIPSIAPTGFGVRIDHTAELSGLAARAESCSVEIVLSSQSQSSRTFIVLVASEAGITPDGSSLSVVPPNDGSVFMIGGYTTVEAVGGAQEARVPANGPGNVVGTTGLQAAVAVAVINTSSVASVFAGLDVVDATRLQGFIGLFPGAVLNASTRPGDEEGMSRPWVTPGGICWPNSTIADERPYLLIEEDGGPVPTAMLLSDADGWYAGTPFTIPTAAGCFWSLRCPRPAEQQLDVFAQVSLSQNLILTSLAADAPAPTAVTPGTTAHFALDPSADQGLRVSTKGINGGFQISIQCCDVGRFAPDCRSCLDGYLAFPQCTSTAATCNVARDCHGRGTAVTSGTGDQCYCTCQPGFAGSDCSLCANERHDPATGCTTCAGRFASNPAGYPAACRNETEQNEAAAIRRLSEMLSDRNGLCIAGMGIVVPSRTPEQTLSRTVPATRTRDATTTMPIEPQSSTPAPSQLPPATTSRVATPAPSTTVANESSRAPTAVTTTRSLPVRFAVVDSQVLLDRFAGPSPMDRALGEKTAMAVVDVSRGGIAASAVISPTMALQGSRNAQIAEAAMCVYSPADDLEESLVVFPLQPPVPVTSDSSSNALYGAVLCAGALITVFPAILAFLVHGHDGRSKTGPIKFAAAMYVTVVVYFAGNVVRVATTLALHTPSGDPGALGWIIIALFGFVTPIGLGVVAPAIALSDANFRVKLMWVPRHGPVSAGLTEIPDPLDPARRPPTTNYKPSYEPDADRGQTVDLRSQRKSDTHDAAPAVTPHVATLYVDAVGAFFDGQTDAVRSPVRRYAFVIEMVVTLLVSMLAGVRPSAGGMCKYIAVGMLVPCAAFFAYVSAYRPFISKLELWLVIAGAALQAAAAGFAVPVTFMEDGDLFDRLLEWLGWVNLAQSLLFLGGLFALIAQRVVLTIKRKLEAKDNDQAGRRDDAETVRPLLTVPESQLLHPVPDAAVVNAAGSSKSDDASDETWKRTQNPLQRGL